jgi:hypothetical protein
MIQLKAARVGLALALLFVGLLAFTSPAGIPTPALAGKPTPKPTRTPTPTPLPTPTPAGPPAPNLLSPADGAQVVEPFTIAWEAVSDPTGISQYYWEVSASSTFSTIVTRGSTFDSTQATVGGLVNGTYFWHVKAQNNQAYWGPNSATRSFTVTGQAPGTPGTPSLIRPDDNVQINPKVHVDFEWSAVPDAASYRLEHVWNDPTFDDNHVFTETTSGTTWSPTFQITPGDFYWRVRAVSASGILGLPSQSRVVHFTDSAPTPTPTPSPPPDFTLSANYSSPSFTGFLVRGGLRLADCPLCTTDIEPRYAINSLGCAYDSNTISSVSLNGFEGSITLEVLNLPPGVMSQTATSIFLPRGNAVSTPFKLQAASGAAVGNATVTVRATSGAIVHSIDLPIAVVDQPPPCP